MQHSHQQGGAGAARPRHRIEVAVYDDSVARYNYFEAELLQWLANDEALVRFGKRAPRTVDACAVLGVPAAAAAAAAPPRAGDAVQARYKDARMGMAWADATLLQHDAQGRGVHIYLVKTEGYEHEASFWVSDIRPRGLRRAELPHRPVPPLCDAPLDTSHVHAAVLALALAPRMHAGLLHWCKAAATRGEFAHALATALLTVRAGATAADAALSMWLSSSGGGGEHALLHVLDEVERQAERSGVPFDATALYALGADGAPLPPVLVGWRRRSATTAAPLPPAHGAWQLRSVVWRRDDGTYDAAAAALCTAQQPCVCIYENEGVP